MNPIMQLVFGIVLILIGAFMVSDARDRFITEEVAAEIKRPDDVPPEVWAQMPEPQRAAVRRNFDAGYRYVGSIPAHTEGSHGDDLVGPGQ